MRIQKSALLGVRSLLKSTTKKLPLAVASIFVLAGGVLLAQNLTTPDQALALTPPDSCFAFNAATKTITDYYDNQANNSANPACPRDVDIPSTIGGVEVIAVGGVAFYGSNLTSVVLGNSITTIGGNSFARNQLTSIVIPDSVTVIGDYAFASNQLSSVSLGSSVTTIGHTAFSYNQLESVTIPSSVVDINYSAFTFQTQWGIDFEYGDNGAPYMRSSDPSEVQSAYDAIWYVRLNLEDASNPHDLHNGVMSESYWIEADANEDGKDNSLGGHIINSASLNLNYRDTNSQTLQPARMQTGFTNGSYLSSYLVSDGPLVPMPNNRVNLTPAEQTAIDQALASYYHIGDTVTLTAPSIAGFVTPPAKTFTLSNSDNQGTFIYNKPLTTVDFSTPSGSATNPSQNSVPVSLTPIMANSTFAVDTNEQCSAIDSAKLLPASGFTAPDSTYTTLGGLDFTLSCTTPGEDASVSLTLGSQVIDPTTVKVYKKTANGKVTDITKQTVVSNQAGKTTISYNLTDGGSLDDDGKVNGTITDPIYVTVPSDSDLLADTGTDQWMITAAAVGMILLAASMLAVHRMSRAA